jgi:hypothetical protein
VSVSGSAPLSAEVEDVDSSGVTGIETKTMEMIRNRNGMRFHTDSKHYSESELKLFHFIYFQGFLYICFLFSPLYE